MGILCGERPRGAVRLAVVLARIDFVVACGAVVTQQTKKGAQRGAQSQDQADDE
jgi:hypothetical protein